MEKGNRGRNAGKVEEVKKESRGDRGVVGKGERWRKTKRTKAEKRMDAGR